MKTFLLLLSAFQLFTLSARAQTISILGPYGAPPDSIYFIAWDQLAGHRAELQWSEDMATWHPLGQYDGCPTADEWHLNFTPAWLGPSFFFRTLQTPCAPAAAPPPLPREFAMWPENAFQ